MTNRPMAEVIGSRRKELGMTQKDLSEKLNKCIIGRCFKKICYVHFTDISQKFFHKVLLVSLFGWCPNMPIGWSSTTWQ